MGWTFCYRVPRDADAELRGNYEHSTNRVLASGFVGSTWYAALRVLPADYVTALVVLTSRRNGEWGYKEMDESMGPNESRCPARILAMLSPIADLPGGAAGNEWAMAWRERCRAVAAQSRVQRAAVKRLAPGTRLRLPEPVKFRSGASVQEFIVSDCRGHRGTVLQRADGIGGLYRLPARMLATAEVITAG